VYSLPQLAKIVPCPRHRLPTFDPQSGLLYATPNWNLVNLMLHLLGPCTEQALCVRLMLLQAACCVGAFGLRSLLVGVYK
jgi:UDP-N-acetylglucosamine--dolichyl-phosphate N-acetylglucosaminephosphotransferase